MYWFSQQLLQGINVTSDGSGAGMPLADVLALISVVLVRYFAVPAPDWSPAGSQ